MRSHGAMPLFGRESGGQQQLSHRQHAVQRRPDLVADVSQEVAVHLAGRRRLGRLRGTLGWGRPHTPRRHSPIELQPACTRASELSGPGSAGSD